VKETMRVRLWKNYMTLKHYVWDGYTAPELTPDIQSNQVLALMQIVEVLEKRVDAQDAKIADLKLGEAYWRKT
jgi:hypothetical protein